MPDQVLERSDRQATNAVTPAMAAHFRVHLYAVIARILAHLGQSGQADGATTWLEAYPFLGGYRELLAAHEPDGLSPDEALRWWDAQATQWPAEPGIRLPLRALVEEAALSPEQVRLLLAVGLVEEDIRFGALFGALQEPLAARRPCIGVLSWLLSTPGDEPNDDRHAAQQMLELGYLQSENRSDPRAEWVLRVPIPLWDALQGDAVELPAPGLTRQTQAEFPLPNDLILPAQIQQQVRELPSLLAQSQLTAVAVRGMTGSGRRTVLGSVARRLGRDTLLWTGERPGDEAWRLLGPLASALGALPVVRCDPAPGETLDLPAVLGYAGPIGVTLGRSGGLRGRPLEQALTLTLPAPDRHARRRFWAATRVTVEPQAMDPIVDRFLLAGGSIHRAAALAKTHAALDGRSTIVATDVRQATRSLNRQVLETLATPLETTTGWSDLVVGTAVARELSALEMRCRRRELLRERAGPAYAGTLNRGVRAMFTGPSGTGKTLAARALAGALQMDLYRVDLAAVVNKYIGETEKNLNQVLARAEELDVVLLLDEGDALMARRTDVRNANDRYANLETNYLLQRLENYEGIVVVTTNAGQRIDDAFLRRIDVVVDFAPPDAAERRLIWVGHLPASNEVTLGLLDDVAMRCALTGGQIRNAALHATLLAAEEPVADMHLEAAVQREYRKAGAAYPLRPAATNGNQIDRLRRFTGDLR